MQVKNMTRDQLRVELNSVMDELYYQQLECMLALGKGFLKSRESKEKKESENNKCPSE